MRLTMRPVCFTSSNTTYCIPTTTNITTTPHQPTTTIINSTITISITITRLSPPQSLNYPHHYHHHHIYPIITPRSPTTPTIITPPPPISPQDGGKEGKRWTSKKGTVEIFIDEAFAALRQFIEKNSVETRCKVNYHITPHHVISCHIMLCHVMPCYVMSYHVMSCHAMPCHVISRHVMSYHAMSCHAMSCHAMSCHVTPQAQTLSSRLAITDPDPQFQRKLAILTHPFNTNTLIHHSHTLFIHPHN